MNKQLICVVLALLVLPIACEKQPDTIPVTGIVLSQTSVELTEGESVTITATVSPGDATNKKVIWSSDHPSILVSDGKITTSFQPGAATTTLNGRQVLGQGTVTATSDDGGKKATCHVTVLPRIINVTGITLSDSAIQMARGESYILEASVQPDNATDKTVQWTSSNTAVATVNQDGKVTAINAGDATITAKAGDMTASCTVIVAIPVSSITLDQTSITLYEGEVTSLTATIKPDDATDQTVTWVSSNTSVATVSNGTVTAVSAGTAMIAVKAGDKTASCTVNVIIPVTGIVLSQTSVELTDGESVTITATVSPGDATNKKVIWSSDHPSILVSDGKITTSFQPGAATTTLNGRQVLGQGTVTATSDDGGKKATCHVTVLPRIINVTGITLSDSAIQMARGESRILTATVQPDDATDKTVNWSSNDATIAVVDSYGKVSALKSGLTTIIASAGDKSATCSVSVTTPVTSIVLDRTSISLEEGQTTTLSATVYPNDADDKSVTWSSSSASVATVDKNGIITAVREGAATISARAGNKTATCSVSVQKKVIPVTSVSLNKTTISIVTNQSETLIATVLPYDATDKTVNWSSSDATIASVDANGKITALKGGQAVITAKAGEKYASCAVTVTVPVTGISLNQSSLTLTKGQSANLVAYVQPSDATDKIVTWVSSDNNVATVDQNGQIVAKAGGSATITAACGGFTVECVVKVVVLVSSVALDQTSLELAIGESATLVATISPGDATDKSVTWSSSDATIASIDQNGKVTGLKEGKVTITAKAGERSATCKVTVTGSNTETIVDGGEHGWD